MKAIRLGVIGLGFFGEKHAEAATALSEIELHAVCTRRPGRLREVQQRLGVPHAYRDYDDLLDDPEIDAVTVATHVADHVEPALAALRAGKHVLLEKPMARTPRECDRILRAEAKSGAFLMVGHICRFNPRYALARERIAAGELGDIVSLYARRNIPAARSATVLEKVGPLLGDGIHDMDLMLWMTGRPVESVYALTHSVRGLANPDLGWAMARFAGGAVGVTETVWLLPEGTPFRIHEQMEVIGTKGALYLHGNDLSLTFQTAKGVDCPDTRYWPIVHGELAGALRAEMRYFAGCVTRGTPPALGTPAEAREAVRVMHAAERSAASGRPVRLPARP